MIFNIGFNKSGTTSLTEAMGRLGFKALHYCKGDVTIVDIIKQNMANGQPILTGLTDYDFLSDFRGIEFLEVLDQQYPGSRYILTIREVDSWIASRTRHALRNLKDPSYSDNFTAVEPERWLQHREYVLKKVDLFFRDRARDLLVIDICGGQGWETLCPFVGRRIPNLPFPDANKTDSFSHTPII